MNLLPTLFALVLLSLSGSNSDGVVYVQPGTQAQIGLEISTAPGLVINRKNPPVVTLLNPFEPGVLLTAAVTGEPWATDPETYLVRLDPVVWTLSVPATAKPGVYPLTIEADVSLCDTALGVCFTEYRELAVTLRLGAAGSDKAAKMRLSTPDF